jgi:RNA polymerase sigma-70 factor (ECF subfamily)
MEQAASDEELARQARAGSFSAFEALLLRYEHRVYRFVFQRCGNETDAREVTQDTFVRAFQALARYDPAQAFAPWLFTLARHKCIDHHRRGQSPAEPPLPEPADSNDPGEALAQREEAQAIWQVARRLLPESQFDALWLRYAEDLSVPDIARVMRRPVTYVKVSLFRARKTLARAWGSRAHTPGRKPSRPQGLASSALPHKQPEPSIS